MDRVWKISLISLFFSGVALANSPEHFVYQGRIVKPDYAPLESTSVEFSIQILSPGSESCLLYVESHTLNMANSGGFFSLKVGSGTRPTGTAYESVAPLTQVFDNSSAAIAGLSCLVGNTYTPADGHNREIRLIFDDGTGPVAVNDDLQIEAVPFAQYASRLEGYSSDEFIKVNSASNLTQSNIESLYAGTGYGDLLALVNGTSPQYLAPSASGTGAFPQFTSAAPPAPGDLVAGDIWYESDTNLMKYYDGSTVQVIGTTSGSGTVTDITIGSGLVDGSGVAGTTITNSGTIALSNVGTAGTYYRVVTDAQGRITSGTTALAETDLPIIVTPGKVSGDAITSGTIGGTTAISTTGSGSFSGLSTRTQVFWDSDNTNSVTISPPATGALTSNYVLTLPVDDGSPSQVLTTDGNGVLSWGTDGGGDLQSSGSVPMAADFNLDGNKVINLAAPTLDTDAATKKYVDDEITAVTGGLSYTASDITNVAAGNISSNDVQGALNELDGDKQAASSELTGVSGLATTGTVERTGASTYSTYSVTAAGKALLDDADAAAQRTTLGLGNMAEESASDYLDKAGNLTGLADVAASRTNLGLGDMALQDSSSVAITGGAVDGATIGATTPATGAFTTLSAGDANFSGDVSVAATKTVNLGVFTTAQESTLIAGLAAGDAGKFWYNSSTSSLMYWNGGSAQALGISGGSLQSLAGDTSVNQTLSIENGAAVLVPTWDNNGSGDHSLQLPMASGAGVTAGLLSKTEYDAFVAKQDSDADLTGLSGLSGTGFVERTGAGTYSTFSTTAAGKALLDDADASAQRTTLGLGTMAEETATDYLDKAGNLSGLADTAAARTNLGLGTMAEETAADYMTKAANLSDLADVAASRTNLGLGDMALQDASTVAITGGAVDGTTIGSTTPATGAFTNLSSTGDANFGGNVNVAATKTIGLGVFTNVEEGALGLGAGDAGSFWYNTDQDAIRYWNGTVATSLGSGSGTVTSVSGTAPINVATGSSTPVISVDAATEAATGVVQLAPDGDTTAGLVVQADDARLSDSRAPAGAAGGDLTGTYPNPTVAAIQGTDVSVTAPVTDQLLSFNGTTYAPQYFGFGDLRSSLGAQQLTGSCSASETMTWSSVTDAFACTTIAIASTQVSGLGTMAAEDATDYLDKAGNLTGLADVAASRTNLGLGDMALQDASSVAITGGAVDGTAIGATTPATGAFTNLSAGDASFSGDVSVAATKTVNLGVFTTAQESTLIAGLAAGDAGKFWYNSSTSSLMYWNGGSAQALGVSGAGLQSLAGDTSGAQTLSIENGAAVLVPTWDNDGSGDHSLQLPMASGAGVTAGLLSRADYDAFVAKQDSDADLTGLAGLTGTGFVERTGAGTYSTFSTTAAGKALLDDADASAQRTTLGLGTMAEETATNYLDKAGNLSGLADTAAARNNLGLGTMAEEASADYMTKAANLSDLADAAASRTNLGLGDMALQDASAVAITGGAVDGTAIGATTPATGAFTNLSAGDANFSGDVSIAATKTVNLGVFTTAQESTLIAGLAVGDAGKFWYNSSTSSLMYWNGGSAQTLGVSGAGLQSLAGDTSGAQTLSIENGAIVLAPTWDNDGSGDHSLQLPMASGAGVTAGLLSKTDYDAFVAKQDSDADLAGLSGLTGTGFVERTGAGTYTTYSATAAGKALMDDADASAQRTTLGLGSMAEETATDYLDKAGNLSGLADTAAARSNLGLGTMAEETAADYMTKAANLSDLADVSTARTNLGLGDMALQDASSVAITGGAIDGAAIGSVTPGSGAFTNLSSTGDATFGGNVNVAATKTIGLGVFTNAEEGSLGLGAGDAGSFWYNTDQDAIRYWNGTVATSLGSGSGTVTSVSGTAPINVATGSSTPVISVDAATEAATGVVQLAPDGNTTAGLVVQADDARLSDSRAPAGAAGGDLSGTYPNPTVAAIQGTDVSTTAPVTDQLLSFNGTSYAPQYFGFGDLRSSLGAQQLAGSCSASETMTWSSVTDAFACTTIAIASTQVSGLGTMAAEDSTDYLDKAGNLTGLADVAASRTNLGLGDMALQDASAVAITGGAVDGTTIGATTPATGAFTTLSAGDANFSGDVSIAATKTVNLGVFTTAQESTLITGLAAGDAGKFWYNSSTSSLMYWNGGSAQTLGVSGAGLQSLAGDTSGAQTLSIENGAAVLVPTWDNDGSGDHNLQLPMASGAGVTAGLLSKADFDAFVAKQDSDADLTGLAGLTGTGLVERTGAGTYATFSATAAGKALMDDADASAQRTTLGLGTMAEETATDYLDKAGNLSGLADTATARSNLGLGTMAEEASADYMTKAANLSDLANVATARTNLGLGDMALQDASSVAITGGAVDGTAIGASTPATGAFTTLSAGDANFSGDVSIAATKTVNLGVFTTAQESTLIAGLAAGDAGKFWYNSSTSSLMYWNGGSAQTLGVSGAGLQSLAGDTSGAQTLSIENGAAVLVPTWDNDGSGDHSLQLPMASGAGVTAGLLSKTDYDAFVAKMDSSDTLPVDQISSDTGKYLSYAPNGVDCAPGEILVWNAANGWVCGTDNAGGDLESDGSVAMTANFNMNSNKIINLAAPTLDTDASTKKYVDDSITAATGGLSYTAADIANVAAGNISSTNVQAALNELDTEKQATSVELTGVSGLATTGTVERTGAGTYATYSVTAAGKALLDDADVATQRTTLGLGSAAEENIGTTAGDIPILGGALTANGIMMANGTGSAIDSVTCSSSEYLVYNGTNWACTAVPSGADATAFHQDGDSFGAIATLGTNDNYALNLEANGSTAMTILPSGNVGIGSATPTSRFQVEAGSSVAQLYTAVINNNGSGGNTFSSTAPGHALQVNNTQTVNRTAYGIDVSTSALGLSTGVRVNSAGTGGSSATAVSALANVSTLNNNVPAYGLVAGASTTSPLGTAYGVYINNTTASPTTYGLYQTGQGQNYFAGNVGIGTTSPNSTLDVAGIIRAEQICDESGANCRDISTGWGAGGDFMSDGSVAMTGSLNANSNKVINLAAPTLDTDASTKKYVDDSITAATGGLSYTAADIANVAAGNITSTDVQAALNELDTDKQAASAELTGVSGLSTNGTVERTGAGTYATYSVTAAGKALLDDADVATQRTTLGLGSAALENTGATAGDIPVLGGALTANGIMMANGTGSAIDSVTCSSSQYLVYNGTNWACTAVPSGTTPGGADTNIQFNASGSFAGNGSFAWNDSTKRLSIGGSTETPQFRSTSSLATTNTVPFFASQANLADGNQISMVLGRSSTTNDSGYFAYIPSATPANNSVGLGHYGNAPILNVTQAGRVGIGTANPEVELEVIGDSIVRGELEISTADNGGYLLLNREDVDVTLGEILGSIEVQDEDGAAAAQTVFEVTASQSHSATAKGNQFSLMTTPNGTASSVPRITVLNDGNVGIGTIVPNERLTVEGAVSLDEGAAPSATSGYGKLYVKSADSKLYFMNDSGTETDLLASSGGTVTNIATGTGLTGGPITSTGTISIASGGVSATEIASNAVTTAKIQNAAVTTAKLFTNPGANRIVATDGSTGSNLAPLGCSTAGQVLTWNVTNGWVCSTPSAGTVTSVALSMPSIFSVTNSPVTSSGTLTATLASQTAGTVFAAPSGSAGAPTFRALTATDIPSLNASKITAGTLSTARLGSGTASSTTYLRGDGTWATLAAGSGDFLRNGSTSMTGNLRLGGNWLSNDGGSEGVYVSTGGLVTAGTVSVDSGSFTNDPAFIVSAATGKRSYMAFLTASEDTAMFGLDSSDFFTMASEASLGGIKFKVNGAYDSTPYINDGATAMTIVNSGYVGIGTTNPWYKLEVIESGVQGAASFQNNNNSNSWYPSIYASRMRADSTAPGAGFGAGLTFSLEGFTDWSTADAGSVATVWENNQTNNTTDRDSAMLFYTMTNNSQTERMRITSAGNVGIGTTSPTSKVQVSANTNTQYALRVDQSHASGNGYYSWLNSNGLNEAFRIDNSAGAIFKIQTNGNVGIGTTAPSQKLEVNGNVLADGYLYTSDRRYKTDIQDIVGLETILALRGVSFKWRSNGQPDLGLIAQEVEEVAPDLVVTDPVSGMKSVKYGNLVAPLIESVKELHDYVQIVDDRVLALEQKNLELEEKNQELEAKVDDLMSVVCEIRPDASVCQRH